MRKNNGAFRMRDYLRADDWAEPKRFLCVCLGGNVRSVALAYRLKEAGQEAIAIGALFTKEDTWKVLVKWADYVVVMSVEVVPHMPRAIVKRACLVDVGPDRFGNPFHSELQHMIEPVVAQWAERKWAIHA